MISMQLINKNECKVKTQDLLFVKVVLATIYFIKMFNIVD